MEPKLPTELHVAVFSLNNEAHLIAPAAGQEREVELFRTQLDGVRPVNERTAENLVAGTRYNLKSTSALKSIGSIRGYDDIRHVGYALRIAEGNRQHNFGVQKLELTELQEYLLPTATFLDPIEREFLVRCFELPIIAAKLRRQNIRDLPLEVNE